MPYSIPFTDQNNKGQIVVEDFTVNQTTDLKFPGKNYSGYGSIIGESLLHLLENFASPIEPARPVEGQLWYDNSPGNDQLKVYDGTSWLPSGGVRKSNTQPEAADANIGDLWADTENNQLYLNSGSGWLLIGPSFSDGLVTGATPRNIIGTDDNEYTVLLIEVRAQPVAIVSSTNFTPKTTIPGFVEIKPGVNLSNRDIEGQGVPKFIGRSEVAESLVVNNNVIPAENFLRSDQISNSRFSINVQDNSGINIGTDSTFNMSVEGQAGIIQNRIEGSNIDVRLRNQGSLETVLRIDSSLRLGINNVSPEESLDVTGSAQISQSLFVNGTQNANINSEIPDSGSIVAKGGASIQRDLHIGGNSRFANDSTFANVLPDGNNTRNIGDSTTAWANIYSTNFIGNLIGNVNGSVSGAAGSANRLSSATTFTMSGDVSSTNVLFDGQEGGLTKTFNTSISNSFIANKEQVNTVINTDEVLINRVDQDTGVKKASVSSILRNVPTMPIGTVIPFAGQTAPQGWLLCDGTEYSVNEYRDLQSVIGQNFGAAEPGFFKVPDLRGRMPLGADNMGGTSADVITEEYADFIGLKGGTEKQKIEKQNLPEHDHNLRGESGEQYYTIRQSRSEPEDGARYANIDGFAVNSDPSVSNAHAFSSSGPVETAQNEEIGNPINIMNPTITLNYIIFAGQ
jgi:microcystin-dependent protein